MNEVQFNGILEQICGRWCGIEKYNLAYTQGFESNQKNANRIKWLTVILGLGTGTSGLASLASASPELITGVTGLLTALSVGANNAFKWEDNARNMSEGRTKLEGLQFELERYASDIGQRGEECFDALFMAKFDEKLLAARTIPISNIDKFTRRAQEIIDSHHIRTIPFTAHDAMDAANDTPDQEDTASDTIQPMVRRARP